MDPDSKEPADSPALNACRFSSIMAVAMTMSAAVAHLMELPAKMQYEPPLYVSVVQPANIEMVRWPLDAIPKDWTSWRNRWEYGHAVRAGLVTTALAALTWSIVRDTADKVA